MRTWIFQATPNDFDLKGYLAVLQGEAMTWLVKQHGREIRRGDRVYLWQAIGAGPRKDSGVVAEATVTSDVTPMAPEPASRPYWKTPFESTPAPRVWLKLNRSSKGHLLPRRWIEDDSVLSGSQIMRLRTGTNFPLTAEEATRLGQFWKRAQSADRIPEGINRDHIVAAIENIRRGATHDFGDSTGYDLLYQGHRYAPKAVVGLAAGELTGTTLGPYDFKGGLNSKCFRVLESNGFVIVTKGDTQPFPDEVDAAESHTEGSVQKVLVNRYERDPEARAKAIRHHGLQCKVCRFDFAKTYGALGQGFIHVHHTVPLSVIRKTYKVDPIKDLVPLCPNCHAMIHKRIPPYSLDDLRSIFEVTSGTATKST